MSQYAQAITYSEQALALARQVQDRAKEGVILNNLGAASQALSRYEQALAYYEQARRSYMTWGGGPRRAPSSLTWVKSLVR